MRPTRLSRDILPLDTSRQTRQRSVHGHHGAIAGVEDVAGVELERLAAGDSVTAAGHAIGYDSTSAFIAMFKRLLGTTPGNYFAR